MPLGGRPVVEVDRVRAAAPRRRGRGAPGRRAGPSRRRAPARPDRVRVARMVGRREPRAGLHDRRRDPEAGVDLGELAAGRAAAEDQQAGRQLAGERRFAVRPARDLLEAVDRRDLETDPTATTTSAPRSPSR